MKFAQQLRERSRILQILTDLLHSAYYPFLFAALCVISGTHGKLVYLPILWLLCGFVVFSALFATDHKVFFVPLLMAYYSMGSDSGTALFDDQNLGYLQSFDRGAFVQMCICGGVMLVALVVRFASDGTLAGLFRRRGLCTVGFLLINVGFLLNGLFSPAYQPIDLLYGLLFSFTLTLVYTLVLSMWDRSEDPIPYICLCMVCAAFIALFQFLILYFRLWLQGDPLIFNGAHLSMQEIRLHLNLSWGVSTIVGAVIALGIPAAMYLCHSHKRPWLSYSAALVLMLGTILIDTRSAFLTGGLFLLASAVICCISGENRRFNRRFTAILTGVALLAAVFVHIVIRPLGELLPDAMSFLRLTNMSSDSRMRLYVNGLEDFRSSPIFGVGFADGYTEPTAHKNNVFSNMYHDVVLQLLASTGVVGTLLFLLHLRNLGEMAVRRFSSERLMLLFVPLMILMMSLVDNFFFYPNFQIFYSVFLALAERSLEEARQKRLASHRQAAPNEPLRVGFIYVEAGLGHLVPEAAVQSLFQAKYGDRVETVTSRFYSETDDPQLKKTERLFVQTVKNQNKSFVAGALCRIATLLFGDTWSLSWVMACTPSGIASRKPAIRHLKELDCHILFTTHWAVAYYASRMKHPPYCVMLCPDPYSNEMFNVDVNRFLIPSECGRQQADRIRMYAGGRMQTVAPPIRPEAGQWLGAREELRQKHGIAGDSFTVVLMDGGYGMARLEDTVLHLRETKSKLTLIALCGTNAELKERLDGMEMPENLRLIAVGYCENTPEYIAMADLFCGKAGANSLAEAAYFGIPMLITKCATYIERHNKNYYTRKVRGAMYVPSATLAARQIERFAETPSLLEPYRRRVNALRGVSGEEEIADLLFASAQQLRTSPQSETESK